MTTITKLGHVHTRRFQRHVVRHVLALAFIDIRLDDAPILKFDV
jgi:hypothetical protein